MYSLWFWFRLLCPPVRERDLNFMEQISMQPYKMWPTSFLKKKKNTEEKENFEVRVVVNLQPFTYIHNDSVCPRYRLGFKSHDGQPSIPLNFSTVFMFSVGNTLRILSDNQTNRTKTYGYELQLVRVFVLHFGGLSSSKSCNRLRL